MPDCAKRGRRAAGRSGPETQPTRSRRASRPVLVVQHFRGGASVAPGLRPLLRLATIRLFVRPDVLGVSRMSEVEAQGLLDDPAAWQALLAANAFEGPHLLVGYSDGDLAHTGLIP